MKSLREIEEWWSIDDLLDANMALDVWDEIESKSADKARRDQQMAAATRGR